MRQPQNAKRGRGRGRRGNGNNHHNHVPNRNTSYESNGPDVKLRGNAQQLHEKYMTLAHDAASSGERISAEAYTQFADHYFRLHQAAASIAETKRQLDQTAANATSDNVSGPASGEETSAETAPTAGGPGGSADPPNDEKPARRQGRPRVKSAASAQDEGELQASSADALTPAQLAEAVQDKAATS
jgi:hypothetical protein